MLKTKLETNTLSTYNSLDWEVATGSIYAEIMINNFLDNHDILIEFKFFVIFLEVKNTEQQLLIFRI